jgi:electron transfer flavoprotein alpha subunit
MAHGANQILVWSEKPELLNELLGEARRKADALGWSVAAVQIGETQAELGQAGADTVYRVEAGAGSGANPEVCLDALTEVLKQAHPAVVLVGATKLGLEVAPRLAERVQTGYASWMVGFDVDPLTCAVTARCMLYSGTGMATYSFKPLTAVMSVAPSVFEPVGTPGRAAQSVTIAAGAAAPRLTILETHPKAASGARLEDASLVVDIGQGVQKAEDLVMIRTLAGLLDGQIGCSRPIASDRDWFPEWLGLSGKKVSPELCLTVGVSGSIQHIVGIRDSRLIAAVNNDESAPIFSQADYGVVADLYAFLPVLMERIKSRGVRPAWEVG